LIRRGFNDLLATCSSATVFPASAVGFNAGRPDDSFSRMFNNVLTFVQYYARLILMLKTDSPMLAPRRALRIARPAVRHFPGYSGIFRDTPQTVIFRAFRPGH
jgi:hypothetical protein